MTKIKKEVINDEVGDEEEKMIYAKVSGEEERRIKEEPTVAEPKDEKFYIFDNNLKSIFQSGASCSFSIAGGITDEGVSSQDVKPDISGKVTAFEHQKKKTKDEPSLDSSRKIRSWKEYFFFTKDDVRLAEAHSFFSSSYQLPTTNFDEVRSNIKLIVRNKMSKNKALKVKKKFGRKKWKKN